MSSVVGIIPSRMGSSRFPGKPLSKILELPMIEHVRRRSELIEGLDDVYIATCDLEIKEAVESFGGKVIMTSPDHTRPTTRVAEAASQIQADAFLMIQGDEPLMLPSELGLMLKEFKGLSDSDAVLNLVHPIKDDHEFSDQNVVKVILSKSGRIMLFSRSPIPARFTEYKKQAYKQSGIIAFTKESLEKYVSLGESELELAESIDMLRYLENDISVHSYCSLDETKGIDLPDHLRMAEKILTENKEQKELYSKIINL